MTTYYLAIYAPGLALEPGVVARAIAEAQALLDRQGVTLEQCLRALPDGDVDEPDPGPNPHDPDGSVLDAFVAAAARARKLCGYGDDKVAICQLEIYATH